MEPGLPNSQPLFNPLAFLRGLLGEEEGKAQMPGLEFPL